MPNISTHLLLTVVFLRVFQFLPTIDMFKQHEIPLCFCYSTQKSDIGIIVGLEKIF